VPGPTATVGIGSSTRDSVAHVARYFPVLCAQPEGMVTDAALRLLWELMCRCPSEGFVRDVRTTDSDHGSYMLCP
jgi:hypothetical protein